MRNKLRNGFLFVSLACLLIGCSADLSKQLAPSTTAFGKINQVVVVADKALWEGAVGDTFRYYFGSAYPILPQPEPIFDLKHFTPEELNEDPVRKELRNYVILGDLDQKSSSTSQ